MKSLPISWDFSSRHMRNSICISSESHSNESQSLPDLNAYLTPRNFELLFLLNHASVVPRNGKFSPLLLCYDETRRKSSEIFLVSAAHKMPNQTGCARSRW